MGRVLVVLAKTDGVIRWAGVEDVVNVGTWQADGYLEYMHDALLRPVVAITKVYDVGQPWAADVLVWWRAGKYAIDVGTGALHEVDGWVPPVAGRPPTLPAGPPPPLR